MEFDKTFLEPAFMCPLGDYMQSFKIGGVVSEKTLTGLDHCK